MHCRYLFMSWWSCRFSEGAYSDTFCFFSTWEKKVDLNLSILYAMLLVLLAICLSDSFETIGLLQLDVMGMEVVGMCCWEFAWSDLFFGKRASRGKTHVMCWSCMQLCLGHKLKKLKIEMCRMTSHVKIKTLTFAKGKITGMTNENTDNLLIWID